MKFRCTKNSIRLRLRRSEIDQLAKERRVEELVTFGPGSVLAIILKTDPNVEHINAHCNGNIVAINLPDFIANEWIHSDEISLKTNQLSGESEPLNILIEKDLACKDRKNENKADFFQELGSKEC